MTLEKYKAEIDRRLKALRIVVDQDLDAAKRGVWCGDRLNLDSWAISIYMSVRSDLDEIT